MCGLLRGTAKAGCLSAASINCADELPSLGSEYSKHLIPADTVLFTMQSPRAFAHLLERAVVLPALHARGDAP